MAGAGSTPDPVRDGVMTGSPGACSIRLSSADPRPAAEAALGAGVTCLVGGPFESLARDSRGTGLDTFDNYRYVDRLVGHLDGEGVRVVRTLSGPRTRAVPPALALAHAFLDAQLAVGQGVRRLVINYPMLGNLVQDVAALRIARSTARRLWPSDGPDVAQVYVSASHWGGEQPTHEGERNAVLASGNIAAATGGADQVLTPAWDVAGGDRAFDGLVGEVRGTRQMLDLLATQELPASKELDEEIADIRSGLAAFLAAAPVAAGGARLGRWAREVTEARGRVGRDSRGAVRWLDAGQLPVPSDVMDRHRYRMENVGVGDTWALVEPVARLRMFRSSVDAT